VDATAGEAGAGAVAGSDANGGSNTGMSGAGAGVAGESMSMGGASAGAGGVNAAGGGAGAPPVNECPCSAPTPTCEAGKCISRGARMVKATSFFVDATEVTAEAYARFLGAKGDDTSGQAAECAWNDSFAPSVQKGSPKEPVTHVDFCDAVAYCAWADKQLCGKIGGGSLAFADLASPTKSQWFAACGGSKGQPYPYGSTLMQGACNSNGSGVSAVGSHASCEGASSGVFDMVGNVAEWVNACDASSGAADGCETIGGGFADSGTCSLSSLKHREEQLPGVGFRCCSK
jgi:formylglycine-generating enzyme required for sulfatase activity